jgi:hypothetical protein
VVVVADVVVDTENTDYFRDREVKFRLVYGSFQRGGQALVIFATRTLSKHRDFALRSWFTLIMVISGDADLLWRRDETTQQKFCGFCHTYESRDCSVAE